ncbi:alpha/beta-hydrolase [Hyaloscypha variabilis F]|uniref:Alpha/beta-hydrolase n=1 Tax=Hyaloscypha variabilis (strain UAMH 11265 / GT02V1 / F) TaxID=1149755 RepID=A0A2J6R8A2_HYAVF|nr:alpha/beta-hydrolase [Hyaloscypha variabilis F]
MSRVSLHIKAFLFRIAQTIGRYCDLYLSLPLPQSVSFTRRIQATVGNVPGSFNLLFYTPPSYSQNSPPSASSEKYPVLINFHGGGYTIGHAADDARWATEVVKRTGGLVVSVDYRLAPSYPFPTGIEDCVSAVLYLWKHAEELNLDISRTAFSGFSAGGNFTYTAAFRLHEELKKLRAEGEIGEDEVGELVSLVSFYPAVDWTKTRAERQASNPNFTPIINPLFGLLFDDAYLYPKPDMSSPLLSPGLAPDQLLRDALPKDLVIITCWGDSLLAEEEKFRERLKGQGKRVDGYMVEGVVHGWDKWPSWWKGNVSTDEAYKSAAESLKEFWS